MATRAQVGPGTVEKAIAAVAKAYQALKKENGYRYDVVHVYRVLIEEDSLGTSDCPCVFVLRPDGPSGTILWQDERAYEERLRLDVMGMLKSDGQNPEDQGMATFAEAFLSDLKKLAMVDAQFGLGASGQIKNSRIVSDSNDAAWESTSPIVGIGLELTIFFDGTNP
jgi:hypothetical protein